jgi:imipenem/basic amino acid-specific outer membrane pore
MKSLKLSLITAIALGTAVYAEDVKAPAKVEPSKGVFLDNLKVSGQATLYYQTMDGNPQAPWFAAQGETGTIFNTGGSTKLIDDEDGLFDKDSSRANVGFSLKATTDLGNGFGFGARYNVLETLGLEHNLVSGTMQRVQGETDRDSVKVRTEIADLKSVEAGHATDSESYFAEAYLTKTISKTTIIMGRQELATPLVYSEKWNVLPTTFDAIVVASGELKDEGVTLVGAYVSKSNSHPRLGNFNTLAGGAAADGAYALAAIYGAGEVSGQAWYYTVPTVADAYWVDGTYKKDELVAGFQLAGFMYDEDLSDADDTTSVAAMACYEVAKGTKVSAAFSSTSGKADSHIIANVGTGIKTKLYTATISGDGDVAGATDTTAGKLKVVHALSPDTSIIVQGALYSHGEDSSAVAAVNKRTTADNGEGKKIVKDMTAGVVELIAKSKVGGIDLLAAYIANQNTYGWNVWKDDEDSSEIGHTIRVVARYNF